MLKPNIRGLRFDNGQLSQNLISPIPTRHKDPNKIAKQTLAILLLITRQFILQVKNIFRQVVFPHYIFELFSQ